MRTSKLLVLIRTSEKAELNRLEQFLNSPYFFDGKIDLEVIQLFEFIQSFSPDFDQEDLTKENAYQVL